MTTIRKIVTSKIDGNDANSNDINEIRPFGETAFYLETTSNPSKLTLMMFDGVRTPQRSKVLSPGVLFGSNADSSDGAGLDTIKLIPDARLHYNFGDYGNDQHLVIDPTAPNHIHIRAGGTIDSSNAELYLGGELTHVKVSDGADNVVIRTSTLGEGITERNWIFGSDGSLSLPNGLTVLGGAPLLVAETGNDLGIETSRLASVSAQCAPRGAGDNFVADITDNDDIIVVREGWNVVIDGTLYIVTTIMNGIGEFDIFATGANFVPGTTYTFINPTPVTSNWVFGLDGTLTTPGSGTISHQNNDLKVEVTGTDVIVLRTAGGDLMLGADASLTFSDGVSKISAVDPAQSGGIGGLSVNGKDRTYIGISSNEFGYNWDFRAFGLDDETTAKPAIKFPGGGWLQEDFSDLGTGGFDVPSQLGSQGAFTLTVKNNSNFPAPPSTHNWTFGTDGTTTLPGAITRIVTSTVAKTGINTANLGKGRAATVTVSPSNNTNLNVGTVTGIVFGTGFTLDITVAGNGDISAVVTDSNQAQSVGDTGTLTGGGFLGGTTPADDVVFTVATLTDVIVPTPVDLTKSVNKLTDGNYTLADGTEGQIMYLVRQTGSAYNAIRVNVANGRVDGAAYTTIDYYPFEPSALPALNMSTLIFTDGAWQASNGGWD